MARYTEKTAFDYIHEYNSYEFITVKAEGVYGYYGGFVGWYDEDDNLISTNPQLTIYNIDEPTNGWKYYAKFI